MRLQYSPLYILTVNLLQTRSLTDNETYSITYNNDKLPNSTEDKLKYFRYKKGLLQKEVADFAGIDRKIYSTYESVHRDFYEKDKMLKIAEILEVDVTDLVDEYNIFLYNEPHLQVKKIRKSQGLTQLDFAEKYGLTLATLKRIEQGKQGICRECWVRVVGIVI